MNKFEELHLEPSESSDDVEANQERPDIASEVEGEGKKQMLRGQLENLRENSFWVENYGRPRFPGGIIGSARERWVEKPKRKEEAERAVEEILSSRESLQEALNSPEHANEAFVTIDKLLTQADSFE